MATENRQIIIAVDQITEETKWEDIAPGFTVPDWNYSNGDIWNYAATATPWKPDLNCPDEDTLRAYLESMQNAGIRPVMCADTGVGKEINDQKPDNLQTVFRICSEVFDPGEWIGAQILTTKQGDAFNLDEHKKRAT